MPLPSLRISPAGKIATLSLLLTQAICAHAADPSAAPSPGAESGWKEPSTQPAEIMPLVSRGVFTDVVHIASGFVAVGERGQIVLSSDGNTWKQAESVPTRSMLTAVSAAGNQLWAVGHDGVIVHSADGGVHWDLQRSDPLKKTETGGAGARAVTQGAPLLGVSFVDANKGFAVGAYSLFLGTTDGGKTWTAIDLKSRVDQPAAKADAAADAAKDKDSLTFSKDELKLDDEADPHLNSITTTGDGSLFVTAERGTLYRSSDVGAHWQKLRLPYDGSMFGAIGFEDKHVLVFGLRGHVYESRDLGDHWTEVSTGTTLSLLGGRRLDNGGAILSGANGLLLLRSRADEPFRTLTDASAGGIAAAMPVGDAHDLVVVGENGVSRFATQ